MISVPDGNFKYSLLTMSNLLNSLIVGNKTNKGFVDNIFIKGGGGDYLIINSSEK